MEITLDEFRKEAAKRAKGRRRGPPGYPVALRRFAVKHARERLAVGGTVTGAAKELGVADVTLTKWLKDGGGSVTAGSGGSFREVVVETEPEACSGDAPSPVLIMPSGARIEGLDVDGIIAVLKELG